MRGSLEGLLIRSESSAVKLEALTLLLKRTPWAVPVFPSSMNVTTVPATSGESLPRLA
jgi:hypothetical protein